MSIMPLDSVWPIYLWNVVLAVFGLAAAALAAARLARGRESLAHGLLCTGLLLMLAAPLILAGASQLKLGVVTVKVDSVTVDSREATRPTGDTRPQAHTTPPRSVEIAARVPASSPAAPVEAAPPERPRFAAIVLLLSQAALAIWAVGTLAVLYRWGRGMLIVRRLRQSIEWDESPRLVAIARRAFQSVGLAPPVPIGTSPLAPGPLTLGIRRPAIVLPEGLEGSLEDDELGCVLVHEAAHVARSDALVAVVERLAAAAYWWNPLVRAINRRINRSREHLCDDYVVRSRGDGRRLAAALVKTAERCLAPRALTGAAMLLDEDSLTQRIIRLTAKEQPMQTGFKRAAAALVTFAAAAGVLLAVPAIRAQAAKTETRQADAKKAGDNKSDPARLSYNDGTADSKKSLGGNGEMISFTLPDEGAKVAGIRIHGSRYGMPQPPKEDFMIYFLNQDMSDTVATKTAPYSRFKRGPETWVEIKFSKPIEVPKEFWVALDFRAAQTKGVYLSVDSSTDGSHSKVGLPGMESRPANVGGDWMVEVLLTK